MKGSDDRRSEGHILRGGLEGPALSITGCRITDSLVYHFSHLPSDENTGGSQSAWPEHLGRFTTCTDLSEHRNINLDNMLDQVLLIMHP